MKDIKYIATQKLEDELKARKEDAKVFVLDEWSGSYIRIENCQYCFNFNFGTKFLGFPIRATVSVSTADMIRFEHFLKRSIDHETRTAFTATK